MGISQDLLNIIACPQCKGDVELTTQEDGFICKSCKLKYPIRDDIPVMLIQEAQPI